MRPAPRRDDYEAICRLYKSGKSLRQISRLVGPSPQTISGILRRHGVKRRPKGRPGNPAALASAVKLWQEGMPAKTAAQRCSVAPYTLYRELHRLGIYVRRIPGKVEHGASAYNRNRCRCKVCTAAHCLRVQDYRERRVVAGGCARCSKKQVEGHTMCEKHMKWMREYSHAHYLKTRMATAKPGG